MPEVIAAFDYSVNAVGFEKGDFAIEEVVVKALVSAAPGAVRSVAVLVGVAEV